MLSVLERIAKEVSDQIMELPQGFDRGLEVKDGADGTPTMNIDKFAEDVIISFVEEEDVPCNVLSEELGYLDRGMRKTLVVDPIDGTNNAVLGIPYYSVSLAIGGRSLREVEAGLVRNLVNGDIFQAVRGNGAYLNGERMKVRRFDPAVSVFLVYMGRYANDDTMRVAKMSERTRSLGCASLEMCLVANGTVDAYYMNCERREKSIRVVDIAASSLILREAGGEVLSLDGAPLDMPFDLVARSNFLAIGDPVVAGVVL